MKKFITVVLVLIFAGCKKKNNIIHQAYEQPLKTYKESKSRIKAIEKKHLKQLKNLEDSLR